jgi:hypothetical protein
MQAMKKHAWIVNLDNCAPVIGGKAGDRIARKAQWLRLRSGRSNNLAQITDGAHGTQEAIRG